MNKSSVLLLCLLLVAALPARAQDRAASTPLPANLQPRREVAAVRLFETEKIDLDGRLDEPAWQRAVPASDFIQQDPDNGQPATEPTEVRILFSRDSLYMGVTCYDSEPEKWLGYQR